jgi:pSer/pThr/pTyr-binding forkhead associated (FHA) protein
MARLVVKRGKGLLQLLELSKEKTEVGRADEMDLILPNVSVSRHHARFLVSSAGLRVEDTGSQNGVHVNGEKLDSEAGQDLTTGDVVSIGKFEFFLLAPDERFYKGRFLEYMTAYSAAAAPAQQVETYAMSATEVEALERSRSLIRNSRVIAQDDSGKYWHPEDQKLTIGKNAMILVGGMLTPAIAAEVAWEQNQHVITKCGLVGKLTVNGTAVKSHGLRDGDDFKVGDKMFVYRFK